MSAPRFVVAPTSDVLDLLLSDEEVSGVEYVRPSSGHDFSRLSERAREADEGDANASRCADGNTEQRQKTNVDWATNLALVADDVVVDGPGK